jgi:hypothetical protein
MSAFCRRSLTAGALALALVIPLAAKPQTIPPQNEMLVQWASASLDRIDGPVTDPVTTSVSDRFGSPAHGGQFIETAGKGSVWVYDYAHHVAAVSQGGDLTGDAIFFSAPPPTALPARYLSRIVSAHGLRLGISAPRAAKLLGVSSRAVKHLTARESILYARKDRTCGKYLCAHDATVIFYDNQAVAISLYDLGP